MSAEKILSKISEWIPDYDELAQLASQKYDIPELFSEDILLSEAILTKIFCRDPRISYYFGKLMLREPMDVYDMMFRSWMLKYFNKPWEKEMKRKLDKKLEKYIELKGMPGRFSKLGPLYAMYLSFAIGSKAKGTFEEPQDPSFIANYLIYKLNTESKLDNKYLKKLISAQRENGGFPASTLTTTKSTIYSTALALIPLIVHNHKSKQVRAGIKFILNEEPPYGFVKGGEPQLYVNLLIAYTLRLYEYFNEMYNDPIVKLATRNKKELNLILYSQFDNYLAREFEIYMLDHSVMNSLGTKLEVKERRKDIYNILLESSGLDPAAVIDKLKERNSRYNYLKKRSHLTLIKLDLEYMKHMGLLAESNSRYFVI